MASFVVDLELSENEAFGRGVLSHRSPHPRRKFRRRKRFDDVVGGTGAQGARDGLVPSVGGNEDDRQIGQFRNVLHKLDPVSPGQHQVKQDQVRFLGPDDV